jgi:hypothetical protein
MISVDVKMFKNNFKRVKTQPYYCIKQKKKKIIVLNVETINKTFLKHSSAISHILSRKKTKPSNQQQHTTRSTTQMYHRDDREKNKHTYAHARKTDGYINVIKSFSNPRYSKNKKQSH